MFESPLLDLADIDLADLDALPQSTLRDCLTRMFVDNQELSGQYAAFQSAL
jgi:FXSXX-COOH protein